MHTFSRRAFAHANDIETICALVVRARHAAWRDDYADPTDLRELLSQPQVTANTQLWENERGKVVAYALVDDFNNLCFDVLPEARGETLDAEICAFGVACMRRRNLGNNAHDTLDAVTRVENSERMAWLEHFGFALQPVETIRMRRALNEPLPPPELPNGFVIRTVAGEQEAAALAALHRAAFGTEHTTTETRLAWMRTPEYDAALDLVVIAPDGSFAASCMGSIAQENNAPAECRTGSLDPLATDPRYQKRGLARALLLYGMQLLRERGIEYAELGTRSENSAMQRAAYAAGFSIVSRRVWYSKTIEDS